MTVTVPQMLTDDELREWSINTQELPPDHDMVRALYTIKILQAQYREAVEVLEKIADIRLFPYTDDGGAVELARDYIHSMKGATNT